MVRGELPAGLAASPIPSGMLGPDGHWVAVNAALTSVAGDPPADLAALLTDRALDLAAILAAASTATVPVHLVDGRSADAVVTAAADGGPWLVQFLERSETEALAQRLADAADATARFVSRVSHDLKNPIGTAQGYAELLLEDPSLDEETRAFASRITSSTERALAILVDIVADARSESRIVPPDEVDLTTVLAEATTSLRDLLDARGAIVTATTPLPILRSDARALRRAFEALIGNAVVHHPGAARVEVSARSSATGWEILIDDDGPGIPADARDDLLTGDGVGLPLTRSALARFGAEVELGEADSGGVRACIRIPQRRSRDPEIPSDRRATGAGSGS